MSLPSIKKLSYSFFFFSLTSLSGLSHADDSEIFFSSTSSSTTRPNVLLILDTSASMHKNVTGTRQTRLEAMKEAMIYIITNTNDVNIGLMRFTYEKGGAILHEVRNLEDPAVLPKISATIISGDDDAEQNMTSDAVTTGEPILDVARTDVFPASPATISIQVSDNFDDAGERNGDVDNDTNGDIRFGAPSGGTRIDGVRFTGVEIPQDANGTGNVVDVTSATVSLVRTSGGGSTVGMTVQQTDNSTSFSDSDFAISTLTKSSASPASIKATKWTTNSDTKQTSPNIEAHLNYLINRPGWSSGNALSVILESTNNTNTVFHSHETSEDDAAVLDVTFTHNIASGGSDNLAGLRFQNINIPQGSTITGANLVMTSSNSVTDTGTAEVWTITAEDDTGGDSAAFTTTANNLGSRTKTTNSVNWTVGDTTSGNTITSPDLTAVIQEVVKDNASWCGGNALSLFVAHNAGEQARSIESFEGNGSKPVLNISYTAGTGCYETTELSQIAQNSDDVENSDTRGRTLDIKSGIDVGLRYQNIDVPQGATILSAKLVFTARNSDSSIAAIRIYGEDEDNAGSYGDVLTRTKTTNFEDWVPTSWTSNLTYDSIDIKDIVQEIVNRGSGGNPGSWSAGNAMAFILDATSGTRRAHSYNNDPQRAPRLEIEYRSTGTNPSTVRGNLIDIVNNLPAKDLTPITEVFYESARYWRGEKVFYGAGRDGRSHTRISSSSTYTGGTVFYPPGCTEDNLNSNSCITQSITDTPTPPTYISPFTSGSCQTNYQVLLTDGDANSLNVIAATIDRDFLGGAGCQTTKSDGTSVTKDESCAIDLVKYLLENDQSSITGDQRVKTYTIGFDTGALANATQFLKDVAEAGGGKFFEVANKQSLVDKLNEILTDVKSDAAAFAAPAISVNTFNRLFSRDEIYFGLFSPDVNTRWQGNVKKYNVCIDALGTDPDDPSDDCTLGEVLDANLNSAVVTNTSADDFGLFNSDGTSEWTVGDDVPDGREIDLGGAGGAITDYTDRIIYTDEDSTGLPASVTNLATSGFKLTTATINDSDLAHVRDAVCSSTHAPTPDAACTADLEWMFGKDVDNEDNDINTTTRWWMHDVVHSSPTVITYGIDDDDDFIDKIIFGTNEGALHFVNGTTGKEEWTFMPFEFFDDVSTLRTNTGVNHVYGMDGTPILRVEDNDFDGTIENGEKVHVYMAQRRGGNNIFALDLSVSSPITSDTSLTSVTPELLWRITGGTGGTSGFERMGQSWSDPVVAKIRTTDALGFRTVLIFGGGYDTDLDGLESAGSGPDRKFGLEAGDSENGVNIGNAIYIVDADSGDLIFDISHASDTSQGILTGSGADIEVPNMFYSIPSNLTVFDSNGDGFDDRIYVGDTAGNVWRVDLGADVNPSLASGSSPNSAGGPQGSTIVGQLASLSTAATAATNERRFFYRPAAVQIRDTAFSNAPNGEYDAVVIASGNRAHPLDLDVANRLYVLRDVQINPMFGTNNLATSYPQTVSVDSGGLTSAQGAPIQDDGTDLIDATTTALTGTADERDSLGWYINFDTVGAVADQTDGEKGLSATRVFFGTIFATTFVPATASGIDDCSANVGTGRIFNYNILTGNAALDWDGSGGTPTKADVVQTLGAGGIPPEIVPVYTKKGVQILAGPQLIDGAGANTAVESYWYNE